MQFDTLAQRIRQRRRRAMPRDRKAGVLVGIVDDGGPLRILLTRRTERLSSHSGQVAFPGGMADPGDADIIATALREAHEEVALPPSAVEVLGPLDDFPALRDDIAVTPVVGRIRSLPPLKPEPGEVARIFDIPVAELRQADQWTIREMAREGRNWPVYFFEHDNETLWGLSAYITLHLLSLTHQGAPMALPWNDLGI